MERVPAGKLAKPPERWAIAVVAIAAVLHLPGVSLGQQRAGKEWVGKDVVPKRRDLHVRVNGATGKRKAIVGTYKVEAVDGLSLLIHKPGILGWVSADDVVPVDRAIEFFSNAVRLDPQDTFSRTTRASVLLAGEEGRPRGICRLQRSHSHRSAQRRRLLRSRHGLACEQRGRQGHRRLRRGAALDPDHTVACVWRGRAWMSKHEYAKAISDFDSALRLNPLLGMAYDERGAAHAANAEYDKAITDFNAAIRIDPRDAVAYACRGDIETAKGDFDRALADCNEAIRYDPNSVTTYFQRASIRANRNDLDGAIADFGAVVRLSPQFGSAYLYRGIAAYTKGDYGRATADLDEAIRLEPGRAEAYCARGVVWYMNGQFDAAIKDYDRAIRLNPQYADSHAKRGLAWQSKGKLSKAFADYDRAIQLDPKAEEAYYGRGTAWLAEHKYDKAIVDLDVAVRLDPRQADAYDARALAWLRKKRVDKAAADVDQALRLNPQLVSSLYLRAWIWACCSGRQVPRRQEGRRSSEEGLRVKRVERCQCARGSRGGLCRNRRLRRGDEVANSRQCRYVWTHEPVRRHAPPRALPDESALPRRQSQARGRCSLSRRACQSSCPRSFDGIVLGPGDGAGVIVLGLRC